jgi:cytochrome c oxidase assembly protein subunit 15
LTAIHYAHRLAAYAVLAYLGVLAWQLRRLAAYHSASRALLAVLLLQLLTGLSNVVLDWPLVAAVLHTGGAAALLVILVGLLSGARVSRTVLN